MKRDVDNQKKMSWPPTVDELGVNALDSFIPHSLFNALALIVGASDDVPHNDSKLETSSEIKQRLLSICADIMYLGSKGKLLTPKHAALGLSMRGITGSKHVIQILNGMGHVPSYDSILRLETAVATKESETGKNLPSEFVKEKFAVLVFGNNDFAEETLTGVGTTHNTNGILFQSTTAFDDTQRGIDDNTTYEERQISVPRTARSFDPIASDIPQFFLSKKQGPQDVCQSNYSYDDCSRICEYSFCKDRLYIAKKTVGGELALPSWSAYNAAIEPPLPLSKIHYLPIIEASPTDVATVKAVLNDSIDYADSLQLDSIMVVFDQAIYAKAQQIRWSDSALQNRLVIRLGEFHTAMTFLAVIGKRFALSGLEDVLVEAEIVAQGSLKGVMNGHMYNRSIRAHKLLFEALARMQLLDFIDNGNSITSSELEDILQGMDATDLSPDEVSNFESRFDDVQEKFRNFVAEQCRASKTYAFWNSYIDMVMTLLSFIRATRNSYWMLHLSSLRLMLPWFFSYDRINYAR